MSDTNNTEPLELSSPEPLELLGEPQHLLALQAGTEAVSEAVSEAPLISIQGQADSMPDVQDVETLITETPVPDVLLKGEDHDITEPTSTSPDIAALSPIVPVVSAAATLYAIEHAKDSTPAPRQRWLLMLVIAIIAMIVGVALWWALSLTHKNMTDVSYTISREAPKTYDDTITQQIQENEKNIELLNRAMQEQDTSLCDAILSPEQKKVCQESVQSSLYALSGSLTDCKNLTLVDIRGRCESALAQKTAITSMDKSLCSTIQDEQQAQYCRESIDEKILATLVETRTATEEGCTKLEKKYQDACIATIVRNDDNAIMNTAVGTDDIDACKKISEEQLKFVCFDTILLKRALVSKDKNLCDYVKDETKKSTCITYTSAQDDTTSFKTAIIEKDLSRCGTINNSVLKDRCHDSVTLLIVRDTHNPALCDTLIATGGVTSCKKSAEIQ